MKIFCCAASYIPSMAANSINVVKMCSAFSFNKHDVTLFIPKKKSKNAQLEVVDLYKFYGVENNFSVRYVAVPDFPGWTLVYLFKLFLFFLRGRPNIIYGRFIPISLLGGVIGIRTYLESHGPIWESGAFDRLSFRLATGLGWVAKLVLISESLKNIYLKKSPSLEPIVIVAHDGADSSEVKVSSFEGRLLLPNNVLRVGYVGSLHRGKGVELIVNLAKTFSADTEFHIVGGGIDQLENLRRLGLSSNIILHGHISHAETKCILQTMDVCLLPNQRFVGVYGNSDVNISAYTSPLKLFEYMAAGKAIVSSNLPVLREVLNSENSILVDCEDLTAWSEAINALRDADKREVLGKQAKKDFENKYTWQARARNILDRNRAGS